MILVAYRHGLRASELTDLRWDQVDYATAFERGSPFTTAGFAPRNVDPFMLHIYAALAEKERSLISERTKDALAKAKERGVVLGNPNVGKMVTDAAAARDAVLEPILREMWEMPLRTIAEELTNRNIPTPRGGDKWSPMTVSRVLKRLGIAGK